MRILFLSAWYPYPANNGSKLRIYNLLRGIAEKHQITLLTFAESATTAAPPELTAVCEKVYALPRRAYQPTSGRALAGAFSLTPRSLVDTYEPHMAELIRREVATQSYDLVIASQWAMAAYWRAFAPVPAIFEEVEIGMLTTKRETATNWLRRLRHQLPLLKLRLYLRRMMPAFAACTVVSPTEQAILQRMLPNYRAIEVIPNGANTPDHLIAAPQPNTLIFSGALRFFANHQGITWFLEQVYPRVQAELPDIQLTITGDHGGLPLPPASRVTLTGFVDDVRPCIAASWVSLAPIHLGGGTRLKILEAMALHTAVVSTTKGAEGLAVQDGEHLLLADTPAAFADAIIRLCRTPALRQRLTDNAFSLIQDQYAWPAIMPQVWELIARVGQQRAAGKRRRTEP